MQEFEIASLLDTIELRGAADMDHGSKGIIPRRLPAWTRSRMPKEMEVVVSMASGVRLAFGTDATELSISALATSYVPPFSERLPVCFELDYGEGPVVTESDKGNVIFVNGRNPDEFQMTRGEVDTWCFTLPRGDKQCELWLPHNAVMELRTLAINEGAKLHPPEKDHLPLWAHYGSSISHCLEAVRPTEVWPVIAAKTANISVTNLGVAGQCHLDPFVATTIRDLPTDFISIKAGINIVNRDTIRARAFGPALHGFIDIIREKQPQTPITLISPIYCPANESNPGPTARDSDGKLISIPGHDAVREGSLTLERIRNVVKELVANRNDPNLFYVDGLTLMGEADLSDLPDHLHPNPEGYRRMGKRYAEQHLIPLISSRQ